MRPRLFYGWVIVLVAGLCYGLGMSPVYYSWGIFAPRLVADLGVDRGEVGGVFGLFSVVYQCVGVLVGLAIVRFGLRGVMAAGFCLTAAGFLFLSRAETVFDCYVGFSLLGGMGIGFSTIVPAQTLGQNWFLRRRACQCQKAWERVTPTGWCLSLQVRGTLPTSNSKPTTLSCKTRRPRRPHSRILEQ